MKLTVLSVGRPASLLRPAIREFEARASRYWKLDTIEVPAERASKNRPVPEVLAAEGERIRAAVPAGTDLIALTRSGVGWSSAQLARYLHEMGVAGGTGATFAIGGAHGLDGSILGAARHRLMLSSMTMPHDLARLVLAEQLYRAGTIVRGEPYHRG